MKVTGKVGSQTQSIASAESAKSGKLSGLDSAKDSKSSVGATALQRTDSAKVELSQRAQDIKRAKELATPSNDIDEAKVARLQALIDSGKYKVDAEAVAERLLGEQTKMT